MTQLGDRRLRRRLTGQQAWEQQVGGRRFRVGATGRQPEDRRSADARQPQHRARVRRDAAPHDTTAELLDRDEERVLGVGRG